MRKFHTNLLAEITGSVLTPLARCKFCEVGLTDYVSQSTLNHVTGTEAMFIFGAVWMALFTGVGTDAGSGFTEPVGNAYARVQVSGSFVTNAPTASGNNTLHFASVPAWIVAGMTIFDTSTSSVIPASTTVISTTSNTVVMSNNATGGGVLNGDTVVFSAFNPASGSSPSSISNNADIVFPVPTGSGWGTAIAWGLYDAVSSGNLVLWDYLGQFPWQPCTVSAASPAVLTAKSHGFVAADSLVYTTEFGGASPTFSQSNFTGILAATAPITTDTFTVTNSATAVNTSTTGSGSIRKITQQPIPVNAQVTFAGGTPGTLVVTGA